MKTNLLFISLIVFTLLFVEKAVAQIGFRPGKITFNTGQTVSGFIDDRLWGQNPEDIRFRTDSVNSHVTVYHVADLSSFEIIGGARFTRASITKDDRPRGTEISRDATDLVNRTVWLRELYNGKNYSLYQLNDPNEHFFLKDNNHGTYTELGYKTGIQDGYYYQVSQYREQLKALADKKITPEPEYQDFLENAGYDATDLTKAVRLLNGEQVKKTEPVLKKDKLTFQFFLAVGSGISKSSFSGSLFGLIGGLRPTSSSTPVFASLGGDLSTDGAFRDFFLRTEIQFSNSSHSFAGVDPTTSLIHVSYHYQQTNVSPAILLGLNLIHTAAIKAYIAGGVALNFSTYGSNDFSQDFPSHTTTSNYLPLNKNWVSADPKVGVIFKNHVELGVQGVFGNYFNVNGYKLSPQTYFAFLSYHF